MSDLSDRQHDAFDNAAKMACRQGNLRVLREAAYLLWEDGDRTRLRCDWCELMGATGERTIDLLEREGVLAAGGFIGIDLDPARIDGFRRRMIPNRGDLFPYVRLSSLTVKVNSQAGKPDVR